MKLNSTNIREIRKFGFIAFILFGCLGALGLWREKLLPTYVFGFLAFLGVGFVLIPGQLKSVYTAWLTIADVLGKIIGILILTLAYYLVITPSAMIKRLFGGRPLPVKPDKKAASYWATRTEPVQPKERFTQRY